MTKLDVKAFALATGILFAISSFFLGIVAMFGWGFKLITLFASFYKGFAPTVLGSFIGALWGFVDGFIGGFIIASVYNWFAKE
ncbi:bacteriophage holin [Candidatus Woesearchaeota archaeon]|nr:bacteriophage holin [Candidatus Woesearchaeota archaeon]